MVIPKEFLADNLADFGMLFSVSSKKETSGRHKSANVKKENTSTTVPCTSMGLQCLDNGNKMITLTKNKTKQTNPKTV